MAEQHLKSPLHIDKSKNAKDEVENGIELEHSAPRFTDERWKHGTWDLNMFKQGEGSFLNCIQKHQQTKNQCYSGLPSFLGFFMAYLVDALTGLDVVGQTGNFICKAGLLVTVIGVMLFRRTQDFENLKRLADEATFYDKQWQASWQDNKSAATGASKQTGKNS
ncbi:hypothetical protein F2P56_025713 [Juglans regia]|uniref:Light-harvesting complex-like protein 3 isotype 1, chloroplastic n=1 Tax=Juglans regia TaxID=51240 RepID=A0A833UFJ3_JUGRE|nr:hypothetical protein F2P56_025713 [Juglans regia]